MSIHTAAAQIFYHYRKAKSMFRYIPVILIFLLSGCAGTQEWLAEKPAAFLNEAAEKAGQVEDATISGVNEALAVYCAQVPRVAREFLRDRIRRHESFAGDEVSVICSVDKP